MTGIATATQTILITYYHQYNVTFGYAVKGGGSGYSAPSIVLSQYESAASASSGSSVWVDSGTSYSYQVQLAGSSPTERWSLAVPSGTVSSAVHINVTYYHQFLLTASYSILGGGTPTAPVLSSVQFGAPASPSLATVATGYWLDSGSSWNMTKPLPGSGSSERWYATGTLSGTVSSSATVSQTYHHQYFLTMQASPPEAGSVTPGSDWHDSASSVSISASANSGWQFSGWTGTGSGSYTGSDSATTLNVSGPVSEAANFRPSATATSVSTSATSQVSGTATVTSPSSSSTSSVTSTTISTTSAATTPSSTSSTATTSPGGTGIPELPFQLLAIVSFTFLVVISYIVVRSRGATRGLVTRPV